MTRREERLMKKAIRQLKKLDWQVAIHIGEEGDPNANLKGFIAGEPEYVNYVLNHLD